DSCHIPPHRPQTGAAGISAATEGLSFACHAQNVAATRTNVAAMKNAPPLNPGPCDCRSRGAGGREAGTGLCKPRPLMPHRPYMREGRGVVGELGGNAG